MKKFIVAVILVLMPLAAWAQTEQPMMNHPLAERQGISISLRGGYQFASLEDWENQFEPKPKTALTGIGGEVNYYAASLFIVGGGYEYYFTQTVKIENMTPNVEDHVSMSFLYGSVKAGIPLGDMKEYFLYGGIDAGMLTGTENAKVSGSTLESTGSVFAFRPKAGLLGFLGDSWSGTLELGYLIGNVDEVKFNDVTVPGYKLDLSGLSLLFAASYHLPL